MAAATSVCDGVFALETIPEYTAVQSAVAVGVSRVEMGKYVEPPPIHGVNRAVEHPSRGQSAKSWQVVTDVYPPRYKLEPNRAGGMEMKRFECRCLIANCQDPVIWQRVRENKQIFTQFKNFHGLARDDVMGASDADLAAWLSECHAPHRAPVKVKFDPPKLQGKPGVVLVRHVPPRSARQKKLLHAYYRMLVKSSRGIPAQMPLWSLMNL